MTLAELNASGRADFVKAAGWIFEDSPWVAERTWPRRPFQSVDALHAAMIAIVESAADDGRLALLRAHPDLGARARMSDASICEQRGAGLDCLTRDEYERLQQMNAEYRARFGFPFLFAVKGSTKEDVLADLDRRRVAAPDEERAEAIRQVYRIARFRLDELIRD